MTNTTELSFPASDARPGIQEEPGKSVAQQSSRASQQANGLQLLGVLLGGVLALVLKTFFPS